MTRSVTLLSLLLTLSLTACARPSADAATPGPASDGGTPPASAIAPGDYHWHLQDARDPAGKRIDALLVRQNQPIRFDFVDGRIAVANACNQISAIVRIHEDRVRVGQLVSTKMACVEAPIMALDAEIARRLEGEANIAFEAGDAPRMRWTAANGDVLRFVGTPTPETRYGGPGQTMYLEVASRTERCHPPLSPDLVNCLKLREVQYGDDGLPTGEPGPWQLSSLAIDGYRHEPGVRNVLRVRRFDIPNAPADTSQVAYALDSVIESESEPGAEQVEP